MSNVIQHKKGDSLVWEINYLQNNKLPVDLTGFVLKVEATHPTTKQVLFSILSTDVSSTNYLIINPLTGTFSIIVKNTSSFNLGAYDLDIQFTDSDGFITSSQSIILKVVDKL